MEATCERQLTKSIRKRGWAKLQDYSPASADTAELETRNKLISGTRRGVLDMRAMEQISSSYIKRIHLRARACGRTSFGKLASD
jgi:hypothetical protein